jgi:hypothetical protein
MEEKASNPMVESLCKLLATTDMYLHVSIVYWSVPDPDLNSDPDPPDPHVFGPPGSGSISQIVRSLSVSFFIEKEPHSSQEWNEREKVEVGERDTQLVHVNQASKHPCLRVPIKASQISLGQSLARTQPPPPP